MGYTRQTRGIRPWMAQNKDPSTRPSP